MKLPFLYIFLVLSLAIPISAEIDCETNLSYCGLDPIPLNNSACEFCNDTRIPSTPNAYIGR